MRLQVLTPFVCFVLAALAAAPKKQALVTFPMGTPDSLVDLAKNVIIRAGGVVSHEFSLIKGFVATSTVQALDEIRTLSTEFAPTIEDDSIVQANSDDLR